jgi:hypothetical protein
VLKLKQKNRSAAQIRGVKMEHKFRKTDTNLADFHELFRCKLKKIETDNRSAAQIRGVKNGTQIP